jgi:hypothetical protein
MRPKKKQIAHFGMHQTHGGAKQDLRKVDTGFRLKILQEQNT